MSVSEPQPMLGPGAYVMNSHPSIHDVPTTSLSSETSSTSSDVEGQMVAMKNAPTPVAMENGPEMYASDASVENQQPATPYMNGPVQNANYSPEYEPQVEAQAQVEYPVVQGQDYEGQMEYATAQPGQEYITPDPMQAPNATGDYTGNGNSVDYQNPVQMTDGDVNVSQGQPVQDGGQNSAANQGQRRYVFYLQITAGEAFPVGNGDQVQYIHGPTLIQLVSNSPNPPPLHTVQTGHGPVSMGNNLPVVSAPSPMQTAVPLMQQAQPVQDNINGDGTGMQPAHSPATMMYNTVNVPQTAPAAAVVPQQMYGPPPMYTHPGTGGVYTPQIMGYPNAALPPLGHPHMTTAVPGVGAVVPPRVRIDRIHHYPHGVAPQHGAPQCTVTDHSHHVQDPQHRPSIQRSRSRDDRTEKQREKLQRKLRERERNKDSSYGSLTPSPQTSPRGSLNSNSLKATENGARVINRQSKKRHNSREKIEEHHEEDPRIKKLRELLSDIQAPEVQEVTARTAHARWSFPPVHAGNGDCCIDNNMDLSNVSFELLLADMSRNGSSRSIYSGESQRMVTDLKPATEYNLSVSAILDTVRGTQSHTTRFETVGCPPDAPMIPRLTTKTKSSLMLKWNAPNCNGAKIHTYILQCDKGNGGDGFVTVFEGGEKQHRVVKLHPSTQYRFRLQAVNDHGASGFSPEVTYYTSGSAPSTPEPPSLLEAVARSLKLQWQKSAGDVSGYILEMDDESKRYGFQTVYRGEDTSHCCRNLTRNSEYKFRLCAFNDEGNSKWSSVVAFSTLPDVPRAPSKPTLKGKVHPTSFRVSWEPPRDSGGSDVSSFTLEMSSGLNGLFSEAYKGAEREYLCEELNPGQTYRLKVFCTSRGGDSQSSDVCSITTSPVCPGQCSTPRLHGRPKANSLSLRWAQPEYDGGSQVTEFAVEMVVIEDSSTKEVHRGAPSVTECLVNGLQPGRQYSFKVKAFNRVGGGPFSEALQITTGAGPPEAPDPPTVMCRSATTASVSWEKPCCNGAEISEYRLEKASENGSFALVYTGASPTCELKSLQPATFYYLRVQAINPAGPGPFSEVETCKTPPSSPEAVPTLRLLSSTSDSLLIQWLEPSNCGEEIIAYNIDIGEAQPLAVGNVTEYCIDQLQPDTKYRIRIQAANSIGVGPYSAVLKAVTKALPPQPPKLECALYSHQSLKLKWAESSRLDAKILNYTLEMEDKKGRFIVVYSGANSSHKVTRLTEQMSYKFRICASNDAGSGPYSEEYIFSTTKAPPPSMKAPKVSQITEDSCLVEWTSIGNLQGDTIIYQCQCQRSRENESRLVYRGPNTSVHVPELTPNTEYRLRVCAVRLPQDGGQDLSGAYSQWELFQTQSNEPTETVVSEAESEVKVERKPINDQQLAAICLSVFFLSAILFAVILQWIIAN